MKVTQQSRLAILTIVLTILTLFAGVHRIQAAPLQQTDDASAATTIAQLTALAPTFQDDFATWDEAWTLGSDGGMLNHEGAAEAVTVQGLGDKVGWMTHADLDTLDLRDYLAEVTVKQEDGPSGQFMAGLLFRYVDGKNFYVFAVQQQDDQLSYALYKVEDGSEDALIAPQPIADLPGAVAKTDDTEWSVKLGLLAISDTLTLLLDDTIIDRATDATYPAGSIGIGSAVQSTEEMKLYFDDVALWTADDLAVTADDAMEADSTSTDLAALQADLTTQLATIRATEPDAYDEFRRSNEDWSGLSTALITVELADGLRNTTVEPGGTLYDFYKSLLEAAPTDFLVEVDTTFDSGNDLDQYGLVFRYQDTDNFYVFALYGDGYTLWRKMAGEWTSLASLTSTPAINGGGENHIGVLAQGDLLALLINETVVDLVLDQGIAAGGVGLYTAASSESEEPIQVAYDNFEFWTAPAVTVDNEAVAAALGENQGVPAENADDEVADTFDQAAIAATLAAIREKESDYYDEFRRDDGTWLGDTRDGVVATYVDRTRQIAVEPNLLTIDLHGELLDVAPANYLVAIDTALVAGAGKPQYGLVFRYQDAQNFYYFGIGDTTYSLWVQVDGTWRTLIDWTPADAIVANGENRLSVLAQGETITLLINDTAVAQVQDETFADGGVGLYVETDEENGATVAFDNFDLWLTAAAEESGVEATTQDDGVDQAAFATTIAALRETEAGWYDGFRQDTGAWETPSDDDRTIAIADRELSFAVNAPNLLAISAYTPEEPFAGSDYYMEVTGTYVDGEVEGNYGIIFRYVDSKNFYFFDINNGGYGLQKLADGEWVDLVAWTADGRLAVEPGTPYRMGVWAQGSQIALLLDQEIVATINDDSFIDGGVALAAGTYDAANYAVTFDDFQLWPLPAESAEEVVVVPTATATAVVTPTPTPAEEESEPTVTVTPEATTMPALYEDETFRFTYPGDWTVKVESGVVTVQSTTLDAIIVIIALYAPQPFDAAVADQVNAQWIGLMAITGAEWDDPQPWGDQGRYLTGAKGDRLLQVAGTWVNTPAGSAYYLYTTGVAAANAAAAAPAFAAVAESFTLKGSVPPIAPTGLNLDFTEWEEPIESAFTVDVPAEWAIDGGVLHASDIDQRRWLTANSPDESIFVTIGDSRVPSFVEPNAALTAQGYAEGDSLFVGDTELTVWPYRPGKEFLLDYVNYFLDLADCDLTPVALPQLTQLIRAYVTRNGLVVELGDQQDAGVLTYRCGSGDEQYEGFLLAATASFPLEDATLWQPIALYGYEAAPGDAAMAAAVLKEMMGSYVVDTQWLRAQFGYGAEEADDLVAHANALALLMTDALPQDAAMGDTTAIDATKMEEFATIDDPDLANAITVYLDPTFGWLDSDNHLLGTATPAQPEELDFRALFSSDAE